MSKIEPVESGLLSTRTLYEQMRLASSAIDGRAASDGLRSVAVISGFPRRHCLLTLSDGTGEAGFFRGWTMRVVFSVVVAALLLAAQSVAAGTLQRGRAGGLFQVGCHTGG